MTEEKKYNRLKQKISNWLLQKNLKNNNRIVNVCSLEKAKKIGLTSVVSSRKELDSVKNFYKKLLSDNINISAVCYIPEKKPDDFYLSDKQFNFFHDKDLDFFYRLKKQEAIDFQNTDFDILIDINNAAKWYPMHQLISKSKAKFKVGRFTAENSPFDLMINIKESDNIDYYFEQVLFYLGKFK